MRHRAFTLIELLVVVAIIALLISILMPSLAGAREASRRSVCLANMKQMGTGIHFYVFETKGVWPNAVRGNAKNGDPIPGDTWTQNSWAMRILPYMKDVRAFYCPKWDYGPYNIQFLELYAKLYPHSWGAFMSYGMNAGESNAPGVYRGFGVLDAFNVRDSQIKLPAESYLFGETWGYGPGYGYPYTYIMGPKGCGAARQSRFDGLIPEVARDIEIHALQFRHGLTRPISLNWTFVDGHAGPQRGDEMMLPRRWAVSGTTVNTLYGVIR